MENAFDIGKKLKDKRSKFDFFDSGLASVSFIILLLLTKIFVNLFWTENNQLALVDKSPYLYIFVYCIIAILVEVVFLLAGLFTSNTRNVKFFKATTFNKKPTGKTLFFAAIISIISIFAFSGLTNVFVYSLQKLGYTTTLSNMSIPNFSFYLMYVFLVCVVPAICEESLFRGVILQGFKEKGKHFAVFMSALVFMLMHGGPEQTVHQFILGVILGYVLVYSGSIWVTIFIHFMNNFISVTMIYITSNIASATEVSEGAQETVETLPSWGTLAFTLVYSLALATLGAYLIYLCVREIKKEKDQEFAKNKQQILDLLAKDNLTESEIALLKMLTENVKDYQNTFVEVKSVTENNQQENQKIGQIAKIVSETAKTSTEENSTIDQGVSEKKLTKHKEIDAYKVTGLIMLAASIAYLTIDWILALIKGFQI